MEHYFLNDTEVMPPRGIDALTRQKSRSRRYFSFLYRNVGYASGVGNVTFTDSLSRELLMTPYRKSKVSAETRFRMEFDGVTEFDAFVDYLSCNYNKDNFTCAFRDEKALTTLESQATTQFSVSPQTSVLLRPKRVVGPSTHTIQTATAIVQRSTQSSQSISHAVPFVAPERTETTLPGQLLTVEKPLENTPIYRNSTNEAQSFSLIGRLGISFSASSNVEANLTVFVYDPNGTATEIPQGRLLVTTSVNSFTLLIRGEMLVQPGGWVVVGFKGGNAQRFKFEYSTDSLITLESSNQAPESTCRGFRAGDLLAALVDRSSNGAFEFRSDYFSTGDGRTLFITNGANLRGLHKDLVTSLQDIFEGITGFEPLALWRENEYIRVEPLEVYLKEYATSTVLDGEIISADYGPNQSYLANEILTGFETWRADGPLASDEFNCSHQYTTPYKTVRQTLDLRTKTLIGSGSLIEQQRRKQFSDSTANTSADDSDNKLYVICVTRDRTGQLVNETRQRTPQISNTIDAETPYNVRLTPHRSLRKWSLILELEDLQFESAEGNSKLISRYEDELYPLRENDRHQGVIKSLLGLETVELRVAMTQDQFNSLGDWITYWDGDEPYRGLLMDAVWRKTNDVGETAILSLFI